MKRGLVSFPQRIQYPNSCCYESIYPLLQFPFTEYSLRVFFFIQSKFFLWKSLEIDVWRDRWSLLGDGLTGTSIRVSALGTDWPEHLSERPHWGRIDRHIYQSVSIGYLHDCDYQQSSFSAVPYDVITFIIFLFRDDMLNLQHTTHI